jgi:hypothetical protein
LVIVSPGELNVSSSFVPPPITGANVSKIPSALVGVASGNLFCEFAALGFVRTLGEEVTDALRGVDRKLI